MSERSELILGVACGAVVVLLAAFLIYLSVIEWPDVIWDLLEWIGG